MNLSIMTTAPSRTVRRGLALVVIVIAGAISPVHADESITDLRQQREANRDALLDALAELDFLNEEAAVVAQKVAEIQALVDGQLARVDGARQALGAAEAEVLERESMVAEAEATIAQTIVDIRDRAVDAFVGTDNSVEPWLVSGDPNRTAVRLAFLDFTAGSERDLLDDLRTLQAEREANVRAGEDARIEADGLRAELELELAELEVHRDVQREIEAQLDRHITLIEADLAERERASAEFESLIAEKTVEILGFEPGTIGAESLTGFIMPTAGRVGSPFGSRLHPILGYVRQHTGVDIGAASGNPIWAAKAGEVIFAGWKGGYGNAVVILHDGGVATLYAHMSAIHASVGESVDQQDFIGEIGSTGLSTGPHLHFEVRIDGDPKDPALFLPD